MQINANIVCLPGSIILLFALHAVNAEASTKDQAPTQWPKHVRYWPEDPPHRRRDLEALEQHMKNGDQRVGVMKMSPDPGEKFYMEYWQYEDHAEGTTSVMKPRAEEDEEETRVSMANDSVAVSYKAPFALHTEDIRNTEELKIRASVGRNAAALAILEKRDFACPTGTNSCSSIGYPNSCCPTSDNCFQIQDTGLGPVGCCPRGSSCSGTITSCNFPNFACPQNMGGGCCLPNFVCQGVGCVMNVVTTVIVAPTPPTLSSTSVQTTTSISSLTPAPIPSTSATTSLTCRSDSHPCPTSLGGGCCHTDRVCASNGLCALPPGSTESTSSTVDTQTSTRSTSITGGPPIRPTSESPTATGPILTTDCPVYFYACSAVYGGGCCQTGRDCAVKSCPPTAYTTIISSSLTVVVPVGPAATVNHPTGVCASGWATCALEVGGNCCPSGWECGTASCTAAGPGSTAVEQKQSPNSRNLENGARSLLLLAVGLTMVAALV